MQYRIKTLTNDEFQKYVSSLIAKKEEKDLKLIDRTRRWYYEITERTYQFDRVQRSVAALRALTHREFVTFWERHLSPTQNAVLSVQSTYRQSIQRLDCVCALPFLPTHNRINVVFGQNKPIPPVPESKPEHIVYISEPDTWKKVRNATNIPSSLARSFAHSLMTDVRIRPSRRYPSIPPCVRTSTIRPRGYQTQIACIERDRIHPSYPPIDQAYHSIITTTIHSSMHNYLLRLIVDSRSAC